jgi:hypothetical protein
VSERSEPGESGAEIRPAPEGYHTVTPWIISRDTAQRLDFVREAFGAERIARIHNEDGTIGHAEFRIGDSVIELHPPIRRRWRCRISTSVGGWGHLRDRDDGPVLRLDPRSVPEVPTCTRCPPRRTAPKPTTSCQPLSTTPRGDCDHD